MLQLSVYVRCVFGALLWRPCKLLLAPSLLYRARELIFGLSKTSMRVGRDLIFGLSKTRMRVGRDLIFGLSKTSMRVGRDLIIGLSKTSMRVGSCEVEVHTS